MALTRHSKSLISKDAQPETTALVSILIPLRRPARHLEKCLASILKQTYPCHLTEIVFVEENLASETRKIIRAFVKQNPGFRIRRSTKPQPSSIKKNQPQTIMKL